MKKIPRRTKTWHLITIRGATCESDKVSEMELTRRYVTNNQVIRLSDWHRTQIKASSLQVESASQLGRGKGSGPGYGYIVNSAVREEGRTSRLVFTRKTTWAISFLSHNETPRQSEIWTALICALSSFRLRNFSEHSLLSANPAGNACSKNVGCAHF